MFKFLRPRVVYSKLNRTRQIINVLLKYGFGTFLDQIQIWEHIGITRRLLHRKHMHDSHKSVPERLRLALEELGPLYVKLGQILSTRPDILSEPFITELSKLQNQVAPITTELVKTVLKTELNRPLEDIFDTFQDEPLAAASLSQVHRATLKNNEVVAVKVQRPGIIDILNADLEILSDLAYMTRRRLRGFGIDDTVVFVKDFSRNIKRELNFKFEANNMQRIADDFSNIDYVHVPKAYPELCTEKVLVMEYIDGIGLSDADKLVEEPYDPSTIVRRCADMLLISAFENGFFHADPHPGNIMILPGNTVCFLDYGLMGYASIRQREKLIDLLQNIWRSDEKKVTKSVLNIVRYTDTPNEIALEGDIADLLQEYSYLPADNTQLSSILELLHRVLLTHNLSFPTHLLWLLKAIAQGEAVAQLLGTDFNMSKYATRYGEKLFKQRLSPLRQISDFQSTIADIWQLIKDLPYEIRTIFYQLSEGRLKMEFKHIGLQPVTKSLERASNRLSLAIILAALVVGSSMVVSSNTPPIVAGIPVISLIGYITSGIIGIILLISMLYKNQD